MITKEQSKALKRVYDRDRTVAPSYMKFRRSAIYVHHMKVLMIPWKNMVLGIEPDGYTHS
jgi:hypothetical protein